MKMLVAEPERELGCCLREKNILFALINASERALTFRAEKSPGKTGRQGGTRPVFIG